MSLAVASSAAAAAAAAPLHIIRAWQKFVNFKLLTRKQRSSLDQRQLETWQRVATLDSDKMSSRSGVKSEGAGAGEGAGAVGAVTCACPGCAMMDSQVLRLRH